MWIYLLKVNIAIAIFYGVYRLFYRHDTFFTLRRYILLAMLGLSFLYPFIDLSTWMKTSPVITDAAETYISYVPQLEVTLDTQKSGHLDWTLILGWAYAAVVLLLIGRTAIQMTRVVWLRLRCRPTQYNNRRIYQLTNDDTPFSFFNWIFINPTRHTDHEMEEIIEHEFIHTTQYHSIDVLISELTTTLCWINPLTWSLKREIRKNLEFIADKGVINKGFNYIPYQYHLLRLAHQPTKLTLCNHLNVSPLKERIIMMNKEQSSKLKLATYTLLLPIACALLLANSTEVLAKRIENNVELAVNSITAEKVTISGKIIDEAGKPLPGVNIVIKNSHNGTISNGNGQFTLEAQKKEIAIFSYIGMQTAVYPITEATSDLTIQLKTQPIEKNEVMVVGYGKIEDGKTAAITQTQNLKLSSDSIQIRLRGKDVEKDDILYIVDNEVVERSDFEKINPQDISSIDVLKDAASHKLLGEKSKKGVIIVTTKNEAQKAKVSVPKEGEESMIFTVVESAPTYPGGESALMNYLAKNIRYPTIASENGIQGRVIVSFVVKADGSVDDVKIEKGIDPSIDLEAIRVVKGMEKWSPGKQRGKAVDVKINVPVEFSIHAEEPTK